MNLQLVYRYIFKFVKKWKYVLRKEKNKTKQNKRTKTKEKKASNSESRTPKFRRVRSTRYPLRHGN